MTKDKIKKTIKRLPYILKMLRSGTNEIYVYISNEKEKIVIDDEVITIINIMDEIIENEETKWCKNIFIEIRKGYKDISIMSDSPTGRTKYYEAKKEFIDRIYQCCIYKGMVKYDDILKTKAR